MVDVYKIFPSIGAARIGPESGSALRSPAEFKVYRYTTEGELIGEVTLGDDVERIEWTVHLANKKAVWHKFDPFYIDDYDGIQNTPLRNSDAGEWPDDKFPTDRHQLIIDPGPRTVTQPGEVKTFDRGSIPEGYQGGFPEDQFGPLNNDTIDSLGEISLGSDGRLTVYGGFGKVSTIQTYPIPAGQDLDYSNNPGWWDDTADGPVRATVVLSGGVSVEASPAWVVATAPAYAEGVVAVVTMYDVMLDVAVQNSLFSDDQANLDPATTATIATDITRMLDRIPAYQQVSTPIGCHGSLSSMPPATVYDMMRGPDQANDHYGSSGELMPRLAGDRSASSVIETNPKKYATFTQTQMDLAQRWVDGELPSGSPGALPDDEAQLLTRTALEGCVGAAFAPGIEMTWLSREPDIYTEAFRLNVSPTYLANLGQGGPLSTDWQPLTAGLEPGDFMKFMAVPWQADFNECNVQQINSQWVHWWPSQRPLIVNDEAWTQPGGDTIKPGPDDDPSLTYLRFPRNVDMVEYWQDLEIIS